MKRQFFAIFLLLSMLSAVFAVSETKDLKAVYNNIKIFADGKYIQSKDSQGKVTEPFIVNGVTYVPINIIPELTGKAVSWDGKTATISIGTQPNGAKVKTWLTDMVPTINKGGGDASLDRYLLVSNIPIDNYGNSYYHGGLMHGYSGYYSASVQWFQYPLEMKYTKLYGKFILTNDAKNTDDYYQLVVYSLFNNTRTVLYRSPKLTAGSRPVDVMVDVTGVIDLIVEFSALDSNDRICTAVGGASAFVEAGFE